MKQKIKNGTFFCIPFLEGKRAVGVAARVSKKSLVFFGYFYPESSQLETLTPSSAIFSAKFSGLALQNGKWPLLPSPGNLFSWQLPKFIRRNGNLIELVSYREDALSERLTIERYDGQEDISSLPEDVLYGSEAVEIALSKLLGYRCLPDESHTG